MKARRESNKGLIGTIVFHSALLLLFLFTGFTEPDPKIEEEGMPLQIRLGFDDAGSGDTFDAPSESVEVVPEPVAAVSPASQVLTQDLPSTKEVITSKKKVKEPEKSPEELEAIRKEKEAKKIQEHLANQFKRTNKTTTTTGQGAGGGSDNVAGNQGRSYGGKYGAKTGGAIPGGGNFVLGGRRLASTPKIYDESQDEGKVVVRIYVNKRGEVFRAEPGVKGSTTNSKILFKKAKEAALKTKFDADSQAPIEQVGTMSFIFLVGG